MTRRPAIASDKTTERSPVSCMLRVAAWRIDLPSRSIAQLMPGSASRASSASFQSV